MDLITWIRKPCPTVEITFDTELGERLKQIINGKPDYTLLFSEPDFVSLLAQYILIKSDKLNITPNISISEKFNLIMNLLKKCGIHYRFTSNALMHCELASTTPNWLADWDVFKGVLSSENVRPDWSVNRSCHF